MHGHRHLPFGEYPEAEQLADLAAMRASYREVFGLTAAVYRFPYLAETPTLRAALMFRRHLVQACQASTKARAR
jgi:peptidoglycan-N-acetylglucosamine deacetylase